MDEPTGVRLAIIAADLKPDDKILEPEALAGGIVLVADSTGGTTVAFIGNHPTGLEKFHCLGTARLRVFRPDAPENTPLYDIEEEVEPE